MIKNPETRFLNPLEKEVMSSIQLILRCLSIFYVK